jgi:hypothetical protein
MIEEIARPPEKYGAIIASPMQKRPAKVLTADIGLLQ